MKKLFKIIIFTLCGLVLALALSTINAENPPEAEQLAQQAQTFYEAGNLKQAIATWQQAAIAYTEQGDRDLSVASLLNSATAQQRLGLYDSSCATVLEAFKISNANCLDILEEISPLEQDLENNPEATAAADAIAFKSLQPIINTENSVNQATGLLRFGDYLLQKNYPFVASQILNLSLQTAQKTDNTSQITAALLDLGNTHRQIARKTQNQFAPQTAALDIIVNKNASGRAALLPYQQAIDYYEQAVNQAQSPLEKINPQLNHLSLLLDIRDFWQTAISSLGNNLEQLGITDESFQAQINRGIQTLQVEISEQLQPEIMRLTATSQSQIPNLPLNRSSIVAQINFANSLIRQNKLERNTAEILANAIADSQKLQNPLLEAEAIGYLGDLYLQKQQYPEARQLTEKALRLAPTIEYPEIAYRWQAQLGAIFQQEGDRNAALSAYEASFNIIKTLRNDLATTPVEPILRRYITLLLQEEATPPQLKQARDVLESLQISELDNFFRDPCADIPDELVIIDDIDQKAAVIYPIILENSLQVILTVPNQPIQRYSTAITSQEVERKINQLRRRALSNPGFAEAFRGARGNPQQEQLVKQSQQQTLQEEILPLAQEIYNWLIQPAETTLAENQIETLVFVLDGSLRSIPMALLHDGKQYLIEKNYNVALTSGLQLTNPQPLKRQAIKVLAAGTTSDFPEYNFPPIPQVETELSQIKLIFDNSEVLLNEEFTQESLRQKLAESDYPVVHLATHGQFSSTSEQTFIVSGGATKSDRLINVKQLDKLLRTRNFRRSPIELLVLSACNTAQGDDEAILGLAGVAVRAGAQSTIATLWGANDDATAELMGYFYENLAQNTAVSKAQALRQAQLDLIQTPESPFAHPYYWAPFVLVGNWL